MEKKNFIATKKANSINEKNYTIEFIMTVETKDRQGDIVDVDSIDVTDYMANNIVLAQHDSKSPSVGKVIEIRKEIIDGKKALVGVVKFAVEEYQLARTYWNLYKGGYMSAVSIGFMPERGEQREDGFWLFGCKILELSLVSVPANQLALAKSNGFNTREIICTMKKEEVEKELKNLLISVKEMIQEVLPEDESTKTENITEIEEKEVMSKKTKREIFFKTLTKAIRHIR